MDHIGRYEVLRELGRGAMGVVCLARDPVIAREVALKTLRVNPDLPAEVGAQVRERFVREARAAGQLTHPGIVAIYDAGRDEATGQAYIAMEYVAGTNLDALLRRGGKLPFARALAVTIQVAEALEYAHARGVVHRDVKAANVLLGDGGEVKLADFGIARVEESELTQTGQILGSPLTMSPEQITAGQVDARSDLFSLGVVFYQMVTGERPFQGENLSTLFYQILNVQPVPPVTANAALPKALDPVLLKLLAKRREDRYDSATALLSDLRELREPREPRASVAPPVPPPLPASPPPIPAAERRPARSRLVPAAIAGALALAVILVWLTPVGFVLKRSLVGSATVELDFEHHIESGDYGVLVDGHDLQRGPLRARKEGRKFLPGVKLAHEEIRETLAIPAGSHRFEVWVKSADSGIDERRSISGAFDRGQQRRLVVRVQRVTNALSLDWQ